MIADGSRLRIAGLSLVLLLGAAEGWGQVTTPASPLNPLVAQDGAGIPLSAPMLDAPVDRLEYRLGPGDVLSVAVLGDLNSQYSLRVGPEGTVIIPVAGMVSVLGVTLDEAEERVTAALSRYYRGVDVALALMDVRRFKVFLTGDVESPGVRTATAVTRVSEVLTPLESDSGEVLEQGRRTVMVRRASGETIEADLARFRQLGDLSANPTLLEGDVIHIPSVDQTVDVFGQVAFPGRYQYRRGESVAEILRLANGGDAFLAGAGDSVRVSRLTGQGPRRVQALSQTQVLGAEGQRMILQPFDAIYVSEILDYRLQPSASIRGQVNRPGRYPITPGQTTVRDLVDLAGGFAPDASLTGASLRRVPVASVDRRLQQLRAVPAELLSSEERRILYAASQGGEQGVVVDFVRLFASGENAFNQVLQDADTLVVPERRDQISVLGAVRQPGIVQFAPGRSVADYVSLAGGYQRGADREEIVVVKARSTARVDAREAELLDPEDAIVVPFREDRQWLALLQTTNMVVTTITSLVFTFVALFR